MAKKPPPGVCVYCLKPTERMTWDHVFPRSWYPENYVSQEEKWKVPSCRTCNNRFSNIEKELLIRLGLCLDTSHAEASGIGDLALRSLDSRHAKNNKDALHRRRKLDQIQAEQLPYSEKMSVYPGFDAGRFLYDDEKPSALTISPHHIEGFAEKVVRGILFIYEGKLIDESYEISTYVLNENHALEMMSNLSGVRVHLREPGIKISRCTVPDDAVTSVFRIEIWGQLRLHTIVAAKGN